MAQRKTKQSGTVNKMEAVRRALAKLGNDATAAAIQLFVQEHFGISMRKNHVSACKTKIFQALGKPANEAAPAMPMPGAASISSASPQHGKGIDLEDILLVKKLVERVGNDALHTLVNAFAE